jgi:hypothetical protein
VSGAIYTQAEYDAAMVRIEAAKSEEQRYLDNLRANETLPVGGSWLGVPTAKLCSAPTIASTSMLAWERRCLRTSK